MQMVSVIWPVFGHALDRCMLYLGLTPPHSFYQVVVPELNPRSFCVYSVKLIFMLPLKGVLMYPVASQFPGIR